MCSLLRLKRISTSANAATAADRTAMPSTARGDMRRLTLAMSRNCRRAKRAGSCRLDQLVRRHCAELPDLASAHELTLTCRPVTVAMRAPTMEASVPSVT